MRLSVLASLTLLHTLAPAQADEPQTDGAQTADRPNIVLILADDMGFSDIGCYGGEIETPTLDRLAANGLRFTQFYNGARCCPTRASLLTGLYAHQAGMGGMEPDRGIPGYRGNINRSCVTIAEALGAAGYATYMAGKWHLTNRKDAKSDEDKFNWPRQRGFDRFFGTIAGAGSFFAPATLTDDNADVSDAAREDEDFYYTDAISSAAVDFIADHERQKGDDPFFLYVAYTAPHWPLHALPDDIEKYRGKYDEGWDVVRAARFARQKELGLTDVAWKLTERPKFVPAWGAMKGKRLPSSVTKIEGVDQGDGQAWLAHRMAIYAAMVDRMDRGIGQIVEKLEGTGALDDTLLVFLSDNGGCAEWSLYGFTRGKKPTRAHEGGPESFVSYGAGWANASNTPFRFFKHDTHEGGICTPCVVHWPAGFEARGEWRRSIAHVVDIMPTVLAAAGAEYPKEYAGEAIPPLEGESLMPALRGEKFERRAPLFWEHHGNRGVRRGEWKLVARGEKAPWQLYHIPTDRCETRNLAGDEVEIVAELAEAYRGWAARCSVVAPSRMPRQQEPRGR